MKEIGRVLEQDLKNNYWPQKRMEHREKTSSYGRDRYLIMREKRYPRVKLDGLIKEPSKRIEDDIKEMVLYTSDEEKHLSPSLKVGLLFESLSIELSPKRTK